MAAPGAPAGGTAAAGGQGDAGGEAVQQGGGNGQPDGGPDYGKLSQQLEQIVGSQEQLRQWLVNGGPDGDYEGDAIDGDDFGGLGGFGELDDFEGFDGFEEDADPGGDLDGDPEQLTEQLMEQLDAATREQLEPLARELAQTRGEFEQFQEESQWKELLSEFPDLGEDPGYWLGATRQWAQAAGVPPSPHVARLVYLAHQALAAAQEEGKDEPAAVAHIEGGGGANAGPRQPTPADRILNAKTKRGASVLDF